MSTRTSVSGEAVGAPCRGAFGSTELTSEKQGFFKHSRQRERLKNPALNEDRTQDRQRLPIPLLQVHLLAHAKTLLAPVPACPSIADFEDTTSLTLITALLRNGTTCGSWPPRKQGPALRQAFHEGRKASREKPAGGRL